MGPCGQDSGMASPFSRVPENVVRPAGLPVEQARRTLRAVQDPQPGIPQAAQVSNDTSCAIADHLVASHNT